METGERDSVVCLQDDRRQNRGSEGQWEPGEHAEGTRTIRRGGRVLPETPGHLARARRQSRELTPP